MFDKGVFSMNTEDLLFDMDLMLGGNLPDGKELKDFNGGYVQQLENSTRFVAFFGTEKGTTDSGKPKKNRASAVIDIDSDDIDTMYIMLKLKLHELRNSKRKVKKVSLSAIRLARKQLQEKTIKDNSDMVSSDEPWTPNE
jgi:hypothetical protein